jgi:hypothetical protein
MTEQATARKWSEQLLSTSPIDHSAAEAAVSAVYAAAGLSGPRHFLWCSSPLHAAWAVLVLVGKTEGYSHATYKDAERAKGGKARLAAAREWVAEQLGIDQSAVEGYFGKPFYRAEGSNPITKRLTDECMDAWLAKAEGGDDYLSAHSRGPFKPLHDLEEAIHFEGQKRGGQASLLSVGMREAGGEPIARLAVRSAQHRLYGGNLAYREVAMDEALALAGKFEPTALQRAMWAAYEACGMWWPCEDGVVFSERPILREASGEVGLRWADGFTMGKVTSNSEAAPSAEAVASTPTSATANPESAGADVLARRLPSDHAQRLAYLRETGPLPLFDRYIAGEHEAVWRELVALGGEARSQAHAADALAVAYETMHRVDQNIRLLSDRLSALQYEFVAPGQRGALFGLVKAKAHAPHTPPDPQAWDKIRELEEACEGPIPISLRAFYDVVGEVNLLGRHPVLAPEGSDLAPDPLVVGGIDDALASIDAWDSDQQIIAVAPDALHKANVSGGDPYMIFVPAAVADAPLEEEPHDVTFVEYLRIAVRWGGFPGWEAAGSSPIELDRLRVGLLPF